MKKIMLRMNKNKKVKQVIRRRVFTGIKAKLILIISPLVISAVGLLLLVTYNNSKKIMIDYANQIVQAETDSRAKEVETWTQDILFSLNQIHNTLNYFEMKPDTIRSYLKTTMSRNESYANGIYIGLDNNIILSPTEFTPPEGYIVKERDWFISGLNNKTFQFGETYLDAESGKYVVTASARLKSVAGLNRVAAADISLETITNMISTKNIMNTGKVMIVNTKDQVIIASHDKEYVNTVFDGNNEGSIIAAIANEISLDSNEFIEITSKDSTYSVSTQSISNTSWKLIGYVPHSEVLHEIYKFQKFLLLIFGIAMVLLIALIERTTHFIVKPIKSLTKVIHRITEGDFSVDVNVKGKDEIAEMNKSMQQFIETMRGVISEVVITSSKLEDQAESSNQIADALHDSAQMQSTAMNELNQTVDELAKSVSEVAENTTSLSQVVSETSNKGQEVSKKMEDTVKVSEKGKEDMVQINGAMKNVELTVSELQTAVKQVEESSERINEIVTIIGEIADQTNLLSLNAAIEAARAGDAGKGFAVVAEEIRKLAETSQSSARGISELTSGIKDVVGNTIEKAKDSNQSIHDSIELIHTASDTFNNIFVTVNETSSIVKEMIENVNRVDEVATVVAAITEEQAASAEEILATSENLASQASKVTENSYIVEKDATELAKTAEQLNEQMKMFKM